MIEKEQVKVPKAKGPEPAQAKIGKFKLGLELPTDPRWVNLTEMDLGEILTDHAYCEQKAASSGISLIQSYPDKTEMVRQLAPVVAEEWGHFERVFQEIDRRGLKLGRQRKDEYVNKLQAFMPKGLGREEFLLEKLMVFALIEARSCERFHLLAGRLSADAEERRRQDHQHRLDDVDFRRVVHHRLRRLQGRHGADDEGHGLRLGQGQHSGQRRAPGLDRHRAHAWRARAGRGVERARARTHACRPLGNSR